MKMVSSKHLPAWPQFQELISGACKCRLTPLVAVHFVLLLVLLPLREQRFAHGVRYGLDAGNVGLKGQVRSGKGVTSGTAKDGHQYKMDYVYELADNVVFVDQLDTLLDVKCDFNASASAYKYVAREVVEAVAEQQQNKQHVQHSSDAQSAAATPWDVGMPAAGIHRLLLSFKCSDSNSTDAGLCGVPVFAGPPCSAVSNMSSGSREDANTHKLMVGSLVVITASNRRWPSCLQSQPTSSASRGHYSSKDSEDQQQLLLQVHEAACHYKESKSTTMKVELLTSIEDPFKGYKHFQLGLSVGRPAAAKEHGATKQSHESAAPTHDLLVNADRRASSEHAPTTQDPGAGVGSSSGSKVGRVLLSAEASSAQRNMSSGCYRGCATCHGPGRHQCTACSAGYHHAPGMAGTGYCYQCTSEEHCSDGQYCDMPLLLAAEWTCRPCPAGCKRCTSSGECTECWSGAMMSSSSGTCQRCPTLLSLATSDSSIWPPALPANLNTTVQLPAGANETVSLANVVLTEVCLKQPMERPQLWVQWLERGTEVFRNRTYDLHCIRDTGCYSLRSSVALLLPQQNIRAAVLEKDVIDNMLVKADAATANEYLHYRAPVWLPNPAMFLPTRNYSATVDCMNCSAAITLECRGCWQVQESALAGKSSRQLLQSGGLTTVLAQTSFDIWNYDVVNLSPSQEYVSFFDQFFTCENCYMYCDAEVKASYEQGHHLELQMDATMTLRLSGRLYVADTMSANERIREEVYPERNPLGALLAVVNVLPIAIYPGFKVSLEAMMSAETNGIMDISTGVTITAAVSSYIGKFADGERTPTVSFEEPYFYADPCTGCEYVDATGNGVTVKFGFRPKITVGIYGDALFGLVGASAEAALSADMYAAARLYKLGDTTSQEVTSFVVSDNAVEVPAEGSCSEPHDMEYEITVGIDEAKLEGRIRMGSGSLINRVFGSDLNFAVMTVEPFPVNGDGVILAEEQLLYGCLLLDSTVADPAPTEPPPDAPDAAALASEPDSEYYSKAQPPIPTPSPPAPDGLISESPDSNATIKQRVWRRNIDANAELLVLDVFSMRPRPEGITPSFETCYDICLQTPGCNAAIFCDNPNGCPGSCTDYIAKHPPVNKLPDNLDITIETFGPYPLHKNIYCHPDKDGKPTSFWPYTMCALKYSREVVEPTFFEDSAEGDGWITGTVELLSSDCNGFAVPISAAACEACSMMDPADIVSCFLCVERVPVEQTLVARKSAGRFSRQALCSTCWDATEEPDTCVSCLEAGEENCSQWQTLLNAPEPPPPPKPSPKPPPKPVIKLNSPRPRPSPQPKPRSGSPSTAGSPTPSPVQPPGSSPAPPPKSPTVPSPVAPGRQLPADAVTKVQATSAGPDLNQKKTSVDFRLVLKGLTPSLFTLQRQMLLKELVKVFADSAGDTIQIMINTFSADGASSAGRKLHGAATGQPGDTNRELLQQAVSPALLVDLTAQGFSTYADAERAATGLYVGINNGTFEEKAASEALLPSGYKQGDVALGSPFTITERQAAKDKDPNKQLKIIIIAAAAGGAVLLLVSIGLVVFCVCKKRRSNTEAPAAAAAAATPGSGRIIVKDPVVGLPVERP